MWLLSLLLFTLPVQTTNLRRNLKKQKTHHPGRSRNPFPLVDHLIFTECDHRRPTASVPALCPPKAGAAPAWVQSPVFSEGHLVGHWGGPSVCQGCALSAPSAAPRPSLLSPLGDSFDLNQIEVGKCLGRCQCSGLEGGFMGKLFC